GSSSMNDSQVFVARPAAGTRWGTPPYDPPVRFPQQAEGAAGDNHVYASVTHLLAAMGPDSEGRGCASWNPLGDLVGPGGCIVLKPNMVRHCHGSAGPLEAVVTDPRLIRAVLDLAVRAVAPGGEVVLADSPLQSCDFPALVAALHLREMIQAQPCRDVRVRILDYRREAVIKGPDGLIVRRTPLAGDPDGYVAVDLGSESALKNLVSPRRAFRVTQYDRTVLARHHDGLRHEFLVPRSLLAADLVVSLPKLKTHRKAGLTGALKNLVGINGAKSWLPHHRSGSLSEAGDEYRYRCLRKRAMSRIWERMDRSPSPGARRFLNLVQDLIRRSGSIWPFPDPYFEGSWWGNITLPAMVCDLNRIIMYARKNGELASRPCRRLLVLVDGLMAGEGEGPLEPTPRYLGVLMAGFNPVAVDWAAATMMGFDPVRLPILTCPLVPHRRPLVNFDPSTLQVGEVSSDGMVRFSSLLDLASAVERPFVPPSGWRGHVEAVPSGMARSA
ncbi:MAG: DUF362 domain-containing protein, partial [Acidobacteriota bacterium]